MVGTKDYTSVGRPVVEKAKVYATVEEQSQTEKALIFKKRRRHGNSQRHRGYRHWVTILKIDKIVHEIDENSINEEEVNILNLKPTVNLI